MKRASLLILALAVVFAFNSCKKDENGNTIIPSLSAMKAGAKWTSLARVTTVGDIPSVGKGIVIVATTNLSVTQGEYLAITIRGTELKKYDLAVAVTGVKTQCAFVFKDNAGDATSTYSATTGSVTLTKYDAASKLISGTFEFTLMKVGNPSETIKFTGGTFSNISFIEGVLSGE